MPYFDPYKSSFFVYVSDLNFVFETHFVLLYSLWYDAFIIYRWASYIYLMQLDDWEMRIRYVINQLRHTDWTEQSSTCGPGMLVLLCFPSFLAFVFVQKVPI